MTESCESNQAVDWGTLCSRHETLANNCPDLRLKSLPRFVYEHVRDQKIAKLVGGHKCSFTRDNYQGPLGKLLYAVEIYEAIDMRKYDLANQKITKISDPESNPRRKQPYLLEVTLPGLSEGEPSLIPPDNVVLEADHKYEVCHVADIEGDRVIFKRDPAFKRSAPNSYYFPEPIESREFNLSFVSSGNQFRLYHQAVCEATGSEYLKNILFESAANEAGLASAKISLTKTATRELDRRLSLLNGRQKQAVVGILEARCRPKPYIVFGPPGTGKTSTLVEAIVQVYNRNRALKILVCAHSNNCADQLAQLIDETKLVESMKRLNSRNHYKEKPIIRLYDARSKTELDGIRIVITTNNKAASLGVDSKFDYVFIDEAGHPHEAESLVPILKLGQNGCLVLAGDPMQLGPVIKCREVEQLGLGESMLERLFKFKIYARDEIHLHNYDNNFITELILCYRCDPRILDICNQLFYHGDLKCSGTCPDSLLKGLNVRHPLAFHPTDGVECRPESSTSRYNEIEADRCVEYVLKLYSIGISADKIGVISPYSLQKEKIKEKLSHKLKARTIEDLLAGLILDNSKRDGEQGDSVESQLPGIIRSVAKGIDSSGQIGVFSGKNEMCQVDTVDAFQGQEKEIIIISTVRSPNEQGKIGQGRFLADSKRFNVAISRAKWLVIVVGHPALLNYHSNWIKFGKMAEQLK